MADIFNDDNVTNVPTAEDLIGEGRKYQNADELAKAYANAESFIEKLKNENAEFRGKLDAKEAIESNKGREDKEPEPVRNADPRNEPPKQVTPPNPEDFRSQIRQEVEQLNQEQRAIANLDAVAKKLAELEGSEAKATQFIKDKADELNVSVEWLKETAMRSPDLFFKAVGVPTTAGSSRKTPAPNSDVRLNEDGSRRNFEFYDKIRKDNPKLYWSREMQLEMQRTAKADPDFYKR